MSQSKGIACPVDGCQTVCDTTQSLNGHCQTAHERLGVQEGERTSRATQLIVLDRLRERLRSGPRRGYNGWPTTHDVAMDSPFTKGRCQRALKDLEDRELVSTAKTLNRETYSEVLSAVLASSEPDEIRESKRLRRSYVA